MPELKLLFLQMAVILATSRLMAAAFRFAGQPEVIGEMAAGILLGPSLLGRISAATMNGLFPADSLGELYALSQLGLVLFMFLVGLEIRTDSLRGSAKAVVLSSQASIVAPFLLGGILAWGLYPHLGSDAPRLPFVLFVGAAMGITAFPVLARILADRKLMHTRVGTFAISCAAFDDLTAWCLLAVITLIARPEAKQGPVSWRFAALALYILVMVFLARPALRRLLPAHAAPSLGRFADCAKHILDGEARIEIWKHLYDLVQPYYATKHLRLLRAYEAELAISVASEEAGRDRVVRVLADRRCERDDLNAAIAKTDVGPRLQSIARELDHAEEARKHAQQRRTRAEIASHLLGMQAILVDAASFASARLSLEERERAEGLAASEAEELRANRRHQQELALDERRDKLAELESVERHRVNIPREFLAIRLRVAEAAGVAPASMPFAGELMEVRTRPDLRRS
jgi:hypothetical protein